MLLKPVSLFKPVSQEARLYHSAVNMPFIVTSSMHDKRPSNSICKLKSIKIARIKMIEDINENWKRCKAV